MPKRGNENAQLSKEDYEAQESRRGGGGDDEEGFARASQDELAKRRVVKVRRSVTVRTPGGSTHLTKPSSTDDATPSSNPFASVSLTSNNTATPGNWFAKVSSASSSTPAPAATTRPPATPFNFGAPKDETPETNKDEKPSATPLFSFGASNTTSNGSTDTASGSSAGLFSFLGNNNSAATSPAPAVGFSFGTTPSNNNNNTTTGTTAPAPAPFVFNATTTTAVPGSTTNNTGGSTTKKVSELNAKFAKNIVRMEQSLQQSLQAYDPKTVDVTDRLGEFLDLTACMEDDYGRQRKAIEGASSSKGTKSVGFSFGGATPAATATTTTATPASAVSSTWASPPPTATKAAPAATTTTTEASSEPSDDPIAENAGAKAAPLARADVDWNDLSVLEDVHIYHYRSENKKATKFCSGNLKLQAFAQDAKNNRRMILRNDVSGKVELNVKLDPNGIYTGGVQMKKNGSGGIEQLMFFGMVSKERGPERFAIKRRKPPSIVTGKEPDSLEGVVLKAARGD